ncbi:hypothetical protein F4778DRAFT_604921 [Xylariomycetidae sp. FL2044]|nr:hypothetical protein F4778DRAFT_604921 [Xylariomycetidae sp. FL2044]
MLATMQQTPTPIFNFDFSSPHRPAVSSPLSSSPLRASQSSPLSPRDPNTVSSQRRREALSSPVKGPPPKFRYAARSAKPNPLRHNNNNKEKAQESRRKLFLKNVRQRADDKNWERRGGDQEALKLEWAVLDKQWRDQKNRDIDGMLFEDDIDDIPDFGRREQEQPVQSDEMMVDTIAQEEEDELDAMLSMYEEAQSSQRPPQQPASPCLSDDDDYDSLFQDLLTQQEPGGQDFVSSGHMDLS